MEWMFGEDLPPEQGSPRFDQAIGGWDTSAVKACVEINQWFGRSNTRTSKSG
jgi:hypothetical protein